MAATTRNNEDSRPQKREGRRSDFDQDGQDDRGRSDPPCAASGVQADRQKRKKFYAHDEESTAKTGDIVRIIECRPLSRLKRWQLGTFCGRPFRSAVEHPALKDSADTRVKKTLKKKK